MVTDGSPADDRLLAISRSIDRWQTRLGQAVAWLTLLMVLLTFSIVALRYVFDVGWIALQESVVWMHATVLLLAMGYTLSLDQHVRVDVFYRKLSPSSQAWVNLLGVVLLLWPTAALIGIGSYDYVAASWAVAESSSQSGGLPGLYVLKTLLPLSALLLAVQGLSLALKSTSALLLERSRQT